MIVAHARRAWAEPIFWFALAGPRRCSVGARLVAAGAAIVGGGCSPRGCVALGSCASLLRGDHPAAPGTIRDARRASASSAARGPTRWSRAGIGRTFQNIRLFQNMTRAGERAGRHAQPDARPSPLDAVHPPAAPSARRPRRVERAQRAAALVGLRGRDDEARAEPALRRPAAAGDRPGARRPSRSCSCSTSRRRA